MPTIENTKQSLNNFGHHLSELNDEGFVNLDTEEQVKFFLSFLSLFKVDKSQITIYGYQVVNYDVGDYDYDLGSHSCTTSVHDGYLIVLGEHQEDEITERSGVSNADDYGIANETDDFINGGE